MWKNPQITEGNGQAEEFSSREREDMAEFGGGQLAVQPIMLKILKEMEWCVYNPLQERGRVKEQVFYVFSRTFFFLLKCTVNRTWSTECSFISTSEFLHTCASSQKSASLVSGASKILTGSYQHKWEKGGLDGFGTFALNKQIWRGGAGGGCRGLPLERKPGPHKAASHEDSRGC